MTHGKNKKHYTPNLTTTERKEQREAKHLRDVVRHRTEDHLFKQEIRYVRSR